jgi:2'-5' RNA ligase
VQRPTPDERARLFVGVPFPPELRDALSAYLARTFGELPGRAVPAANWHLTLRFLGDTDGARRVRVTEELRGSITAAPFTLALTSPGAFPRPARATVLWIGVGEGLEALGRLAAQAEEAAVRAGYAPETRPFAAHLTLSRIQPPADLRPVLQREPAFGGSFFVDRVALYRSRLGGGPARYEVLEEFPLA